MPSQPLDWNFYRYPEMENAQRTKLRTFWQDFVGPTSSLTHFDITLEIATLYHGDLSLFLPRGIQGTLSYCGGEVNPWVVIVPAGSWVKHRWSGTVTQADLTILASTYRNEGDNFMEIPLEESSYPDRWMCSRTVSGRLSDTYLSRFPSDVDTLHTLTYTLVPHVEGLSVDDILRTSRSTWNIPSLLVLREVAMQDQQCVRVPLFRILQRAGDSAVYRPLRVFVDESKPLSDRYKLSMASGWVRVTVDADGERFWWESNGNPRKCLSREGLIFRLSSYQPVVDGVWEKYGLAFTVDDWVREVPTVIRSEDASLPLVRLGPVMQRYLDWIEARYSAGSTVEEIEQRLTRRLCRAEVVFYCFLRSQDLKLDHRERSCYWWLGDLIAEHFRQEKDRYSRMLGQYISSSPPESKQHQAYVEVLAAVQRAKTLT